MSWLKLNPNLFLLIRTEAVLDSEDCHDIAKKDILLSTLSEHFAHKQYHDGRFGFVLGFSGPSEEKMKKIIIALEKWFTEILDNV